MENNNKNNKLTPQEFARLVRVSTSTLRRWEKEGFLSPQRSASGHRRYDLSQVNLAKLHHEDAQKNLSRLSKERVSVPNSENLSSTRGGLPSGQNLANSIIPRLRKPLIYAAIPALVGTLAFTVFSFVPLPFGGTSNKPTSFFRYYSAQSLKSKILGFSTAKVLAAADVKNDISLIFNIPTIFKRDIDAKGQNLDLGVGKITAGNVIYSVTAGSGIAVTAGQNPEISNTGVLSIGGEVGELEFSAGEGIEVDGLQITNADLGSSQAIFKNIKIGANTIVSTTNNDILTIDTGTGVTATADISAKKITFTTPWTLLGTTIYPTTTTNTIATLGSIGVGTTAPQSAFSVGSSSQFQVNSQGDIIRLKNLTYSWPALQATTNRQVLTNDGSGNLTWGSLLSVDVDDDTLDFTEFKDLMSLDAATDIALGGYNFSFSGVGNVGVGTTSPLARLHVEGQCVTGDTLLKRRKRRKRNRHSGDPDPAEGRGDSRIGFNADSGPYFAEASHGRQARMTEDWEDVRIDQIKEGDEILTLNETTGEFVVNKVTKLMDMGIQDVYRLHTRGGLHIETTDNHPYLAITRKISLRPSFGETFEVDLSPRIENPLNSDTVIAIANKESAYSLKITSKDKLKFREFYPKDSKTFAPELYAYTIVEILLRNKLNPSKLLIDNDYSSHERRISNILNRFYPDVTISFISVGHNSPAHKKAYFDKKQKKTGVSLLLEGNLTAELLYDEWLQGTTAHTVLVDPSYQERISVSRGATWTKVAYLQAGDSIATKNGWQKISSIYPTGRKQVWDIEVEGTHNFVGNGIVAHNTYINGNVGIGTTAPNYALQVTGTGYFGGALTLGTQATTTAHSVRADRTLTLTSDSNITITNSGTAQDLTSDRSWTIGWTGQLPLARGGTGIGTTNPANGTLLIGTGTGYTVANITGTTDQITVTNGSGTIGLSLPQSIATTSSPTFVGLTLSGLNPSQAVYTDSNRNLTSTIPTSGALGFWTRSGTTLFPTTLADNIGTTGNVGVGTTSPLAKLHVEGQCVTGDTLLPIRRKKRKYKKDDLDRDPYDDGFDHLLERIDNIKKGDEVLSLNENTNEFEYRKIKGLLDMGKQETYLLKTESGRYIETTASHPYLVKNAILDNADPFALKTGYLFVDETGMGNDPNQPYFGVGGLFIKNTVDLNVKLHRIFEKALSIYGKSKTSLEFKFSNITNDNKKLYLEMIEALLSATEWQFNAILIKKGGKGWTPFSFWHRYLGQITELVNLLPNERISIVADYLSKPNVSTKQLTDILYKKNIENVLQLESQGSLLLQITDVILGAIAFMLRQNMGNKKTFTKEAKLEIAKLVWDKMQKTIKEDGDGNQKDGYKVTLYRLVASTAHSLCRYKDIVSKQDTFVNTITKWTKVSQLAVGQEIAVMGSEKERFEKIISIEKISRKQVWDIEVEGTHNFVAGHLLDRKTGKPLSFKKEQKILKETKGDISSYEFENQWNENPLEFGGIVAHNTYINGNVGIGTTAPNYALEVTGTGYFGGALTLGTQATTTAHSVRADRTLTLTSDSNVTITNSGTAQDLTADRSWTIGWTGQLPLARGGTGIGTTNPANGTLLIGTGTGYTVANITGTTDQITVTNGSGTIGLSLPQSIATTSSPTFVGLTLSGLNPSQAVYTDSNRNLTSTIPTTGALGFWQRNGTTVAPATIADYVGIGTTSALNALSVSGSVAFGVLPGAALPQANSAYFSGNVGIGTTGPSQKLEIYGHIALSASGSNHPAFGITATPVTNTLDFARGDAYFGAVNLPVGSATTGLWINNSGNVGIGTTGPGQLLTVNGNTKGLRLSDTASYYLDIITQYDSTALYRYDFKTNDAGTLRDVMTIRAGNVGIGTTAPGDKLTVLPSSGKGITLRESDDGNDAVRLVAGATQGYIDILHSNVVQVRLDANGSSWFNQGNVGIGTTGPSEKLEISGTGMQNKIKVVSGSGSGSYYFDIGSYYSEESFALNVGGYKVLTTGGYDTPEYTYLWSNNSKAVTLDNTGNVGIGTVSPGTKLSVKGAGVFGSTDAWVQSAVSAGTDLAIQGNVGIGTTSPGQLLTLNKASGGGVNSIIQFSVSDVAKGYFGAGVGAGEIITGSTEGDISLRTQGGAINFSADSGATIQMVLKNSGNVGIGTTGPGTLFTVASNQSNTSTFSYLNFNNLGSGYGDWWIQKTGSNDLTFAYGVETEAGKSLTLQYSGNVGIGTTAPGYKLEVIGDGRFSNNLTTSGTLGINTIANSSYEIMSVFGSGGQFDFNVWSETGNTQLYVINSGPGVANLNVEGVGLFDGSGASKFTGSLAVGAENPGTAKLYINGNVGIGTTGPGAYRLNIQAAQADTYIKSTTGTNRVFTVFNNTGGNVWVGEESSAGGQALVGTSPYAAVFGHAGAYPVQFGTNNAVNMTILSGGNVGIGTTAPSTLLSLGTAVGMKLSIYDNGGSDATSYGFGTESGRMYARTSGKTEAMVWAADGSVGIGTSNPTYPLVIYATTARINLQSSTTTNGAFVNFQNTSSGYLGVENSTGTNFTTTGGLPYAFVVNQSSAYPLQLATSDTVRMTINSTGNVGIGTTVPSGKLDVSVLSSDSTTNPLVIGKGTSNYVTILNSGNVGIGTTGPGALLEVKQTANAPTMIIGNDYDTGTYLRYGSTNYGQIYGHSGIFQLKALNNYEFRLSAVSATAPITFYTNSAERVRIDSSGNVGIGTTSPSEKLHVIGNVQFSGDIFGRASGLNPAIDLWNSSDVRTVLINPSGNTFLNGGNVGIGTTGPLNNLQIGTQTSSGVASPVTLSLGGTYSTTAGANPKLKIWDAGGIAYYGLGVSANEFDFMAPGSAGFAFFPNAGATAQVVINSTGNVGIGTTGPGYKLHVLGTDAATASLAQQRNSADIYGPYQYFIKGRVAGASANVGDLTGGPLFAVRNSTDIVGGQLASIQGYVEDPTNAQEDGSLVFYTTAAGTGTEKVRIDSAGNVGIGTTNPLQKLSVIGKVVISDMTGTGGVAVYHNSGVLGIQSSDERLKENIIEIPNALNKISQIRGVNFNWRSDPDKKLALGMIAQEVMQTVPEATYSFVQDGTTYYGIHYAEMTGLLLQGIKEQQMKIDKITGEVTALSAAQTTLSVDVTDTQPPAENLSTSDILDSQSRDIASNATAVETLKSRMDLVEGQLALLGQLGSLGVGTSEPEPSVGIGSSAPALPKLEDIFAISDKDISVDRDLVVYKNFNALGVSTFSDLIVTGKITSGLLVIDGLGENGVSIAAISGDLVLQNTVTIDSKGNVTILGQVTAQKINVKAADVAAASAGKVVIPIGTTSVKVSTTAVTNTSLIYATPNAPVVVGAKYSGEGELEIMLNAPALEDTEVNWWVVN